MTQNILSTLQKEDIILESNIAKLFKIPFDIKSAETITDDFYEKHKTYKYKSNDGKYLEQSLSLRIELNNNLNTDVTLIVKTVGKFSAQSQYVTETYPGLCKNIVLKAGFVTTMSASSKSLMHSPEAKSPLPTKSVRIGVPLYSVNSNLYEWGSSDTSLST